MRLLCAQRLVTLHGPAGIGKTTLGHVAAQRLAEAGAFPSGVFWVSLRGVAREALAREAVAQLLPASGEPCLVVLDGADQLAGAALVGALLARFPQLHLLLIVRQPLGLAQEAALALGALTPGDARRLLVGSVPHTLDPDEAAALVRLLDANPQAIRFMATLLEAAELGPLRTEFERRLMLSREASPLTLARDLLLEVLPAPSRRLLGILSRFASGAGAEDLQLVWGSGWAEPLELLLRAGLVRDDESRYSVVVDLPEMSQPAVLGPTGILLTLALGHLSAGQTDAAFDLAERALTTARGAQNRVGFAHALLVLGRITLSEEPARAVLILEEAATHFESLSDPAGQAEARLWQGRALSQLDEPEAALAALHEAQELQKQPKLSALFSALQTLFTARGGGSLLTALEEDAGALRESGLLAARVRLGLPGK